MIISQPRHRRQTRTLAAAGAAFSVVMFATTAWVSAESASPAAAAAVGGTALVVAPDTGDLLESGDADTPFTLDLPTGAACSGDGEDGYRIYGYMVATDTDPATLTFDSFGPTDQHFGAPQAEVRTPLYDVNGSPYASAFPAPDSGTVVNIPAFHYATLVPVDELPSGDYDIGIACWGPVGAGPTLDQFWNAQVSIVATGGAEPTATWTLAADDATPTTTALAAVPASEANEGDDVTLTATVSPSAAEGAVAFFRDGATIGAPVAVDGGVAELTISDLAVGSFDLTARFVPADDVVYSTSDSAPVAYEIVGAEPADTTITVTADPEDEAVIGDDVTITATVSPAGAAGSVTFLDGPNDIGIPVAVTGGEATITVDDLALGAHTLGAEFEPTDPDAFGASTATPIDYVIVAEDPPNPPVDGEVARVVDPVTGAGRNSGAADTPFTFKLPEGAACTGDGEAAYRIYGYMVAADIDPGTLTFDSFGPTPQSLGEPQDEFRAPLYDVNGTPYVNAFPAPASPSPGPGPVVNLLHFHLATLTPVSELPSGDYNIGVACWGPVGDDPVLDEFWNAPMTVTATSGEPGTIAWTVDQAADTTTTLSADPAGEAPLGDEITLIATVTPSAAVGTVTFYRDETAIGSGPVTVTGGLAEVATSDLGAGTFDLTARFTPTDTDDFIASQSTAVAYEITDSTTTTTLAVTPTGTAAAGETVTLTATVAPDDAEGSVTFFDGETAIGTAVAVSTGTASTTTTALPVGTRTLTASFAPADGTPLEASESEPVTYEITDGDPIETTITLTVSPSGEAEVGEDVRLTATVTPADVEGTVVFKDGDEELDGVASQVAALAVAVASNGKAILTVDDLALGSHTFTATFDPDDPALAGASDSSPVTLRIVAAAATSTSSTSTTLGSTTSTTGGSTTSTTAGTGGGSLPRTGTSPWGLVGWAVLAIVLGRAAILLGRSPALRPAVRR